jgi:hypothetical protein
LRPLGALHRGEYLPPDFQSVGPRYGPACFGTIWGRSSKPKGPVRLRIYPNRLCSSGRAAVFSVQHLFCFNRGCTIRTRTDSAENAQNKTGGNSPGGKDMSRFMASNRRHPFEILSRLRHPSGRFKEMLFALSYTVALLGFFCFMNKVADEVRPPSRPVRLVSQPSA